MGRTRTQRALTFSDEEWESVRTAASQDGQSATEWAREKLLAAAGAPRNRTDFPRNKAEQMLLHAVFLLMFLATDHVVAGGKKDALDRAQARVIKHLRTLGLSSTEDTDVA